MVDCVLRMVKNTGWSLDSILDLDHETFDEMFNSVLRIEYLEKTEHAWTMMIAAQGRHDSMKKWVGGWSTLTEADTSTKQPQNQLDEFLKLFGGGF